MKKFITIFLSLLTMGSIEANVIMYPSFMMLGKIDQIFSLIIAAMFILEFIVFCWLLPKESRLRIGFVVILMNLASAFFGLITKQTGYLRHFLAYSGLALILEPLIIGLELLHIPLPDIAEPMIMSIGFTLLAAAVNTLIEFPIAWLFFGKVNAKKLIWYIFIINLLSVALATVSVLIYEYWYGPIPKHHPGFW